MDDEATRRKIKQANAEGRCPQCGGLLGDDRVGSGPLRDGIFCKLACQASFYEGYYRERARASNPSRN